MQAFIINLLKITPLPSNWRVLVGYVFFMISSIKFDISRFNHFTNAKHLLICNLLSQTSLKNMTCRIQLHLLNNYCCYGVPYDCVIYTFNMFWIPPASSPQMTWTYAKNYVKFNKLYMFKVFDIVPSVNIQIKHSMKTTSFEPDLNQWPMDCC